MIVWLRHGQSTWNAAGRLQGHTAHPPLTELGRAQAQQAAEQLAVLDIARIVTSPAVRARQTACLVGRHLGLEVRVDPRLIEQGLAEPAAHVEQRTRAVLDDIADDTGVLLVSHGDVIGLAVARATGTPPRCPDNGEVIVLDPTS